MIQCSQSKLIGNLISFIRIPFFCSTLITFQLILHFSMHFDRVVSFDYVDFVVGYSEMFKVVGNKIIEIQLVTIMVSTKLTFDHHLLIDL